MIKILNYLKDIRTDDNNKSLCLECNSSKNKCKNCLERLNYIKFNSNICRQLNISEENEKIFILLTNGSYHLLSQIIKFSQNNNYNTIKDKEIKQNEEFSFDYNNKEDKILSTMVKNTHLYKLFSFNKNKRNIPNLRKFMEIFSILQDSNIKYCIIYLEDEMGNTYDKDILNEIKFILNSNKSKDYNINFQNIKKAIDENNLIEINNIIYKKAITIFINLLISTEIKIKREFNNYLYLLKQDNSLQQLINEIISELKEVSLYKNLKALIYLDINNESTKTLEKYLSDKITCEFILKEFHQKIDYESFLQKTIFSLDSWLNEASRLIFSFNLEENILFDNNGELSSSKILKVIEYNINQYFNNTFKFKNKYELKALVYDENNSNDLTLFKKISIEISNIIKEFKKLIFNYDFIKFKELIISLIHNYKCYYVYKIVFDIIKQKSKLQYHHLAIDLFNIKFPH